MTGLLGFKDEVDFFFDFFFYLCSMHFFVATINVQNHHKCPIYAELVPVICDIE